KSTPPISHPTPVGRTSKLSTGDPHPWSAVRYGSHREAAGPAHHRVLGGDRGPRPRRADCQAGTTSTATVAVVSWPRSTTTLNAPVDLTCSLGIWVLRLSSVGPPAGRTAEATWPAVTEPKSFPASEVLTASLTSLRDSRFCLSSFA